MSLLRVFALRVEVSGRRVVAVAAFLRVVLLHARPLAHRHRMAILLVLLLGVDVAGPVAPNLARRLDLADHHRQELFRQMAVRARGLDPRAVLVVDRALELRVRVVAQLVAADAELLRGGEMQRGGAGADHGAADHEAENQNRNGESQRRAVRVSLAEAVPPAHLRLLARQYVSGDVFDFVLGLLAGLVPGDEFLEIRPLPLYFAELALNEGPSFSALAE